MDQKKYQEKQNIKGKDYTKQNLRFTKAACNIYHRNPFLNMFSDAVLLEM